ncbi:helix-turn-helix domain-containing protein [Flagellimonas aequoris]|uniref:Helix-turn-helix domain-containing protein n=1 Tax=Flagellimonas aequoris TaxID=2306997 RepID=A0A418N9P3_9FLAO|nr:XRE family transcriptional regulator [Allomuricauda aequoris]RIV72086.1 XRE family transcriptional regulator [Allomuricauda aequoris]TXK03857.1 helix-turn-helix domain-containing protein [Allomuricauda aequoris]
MEEEYIKLIFGLKLKQVRTKRKLSLFGLSKLTGLSKSYLNEIEKGKKYPKTDKIALLAEKLEVPYDSLVSLKLDKNLAPVGELLQSKVFKELPLELFGIKESDLIDIVANAPTKVNAFISTIIEIAKHYNFGKENFYLASLRSFQEASNNFFPDLEDSALQFAKAYQVDLKKSVSSSELEEILVEEYGYTINNEELTKYKELDNLRSMFIPKTKTLLVANHIDEAQRTFIYAKEIGYNFLNIEERLYTFTWIKFHNFDQVLNNFYASYFAGALVIPRDLIKKHVDSFLSKPKFDKTFLTGIKNYYNASPESLYQRLTNILPNDYHLENLFFLRLSHKKNSNRFDITKELHLTHHHSPHGNETNEKYCRRWVSIRVLQEIAKTEEEHHMDIQISHYPSDGLSYLIFSSATVDPFKKDEYRSVSLGLLINAELRKKVVFLDDPAIKTYEVGVTCERCSIANCDVRQAQPTILKRQERNVKTEKVVQELQKKFS